MSDRQAWLRENLPGVASAVEEFASTFGRPNLTINYASEGGNALGKESGLFGSGVSGSDLARSKRCDGCRHMTVKLVSPEGKRLLATCKLYRVSVSRCADWEK